MANQKTVSRIALGVAIFLTLVVGGSAVYLAYQVNKVKLERSRAASCVPEGGDCVIDSDCCTLMCDLDQKTCLGCFSEGAGCSLDENCCTGFCDTFNYRCAPKLGLGETCVEDDDCVSGICLDTGSSGLKCAEGGSACCEGCIGNACYNCRHCSNTCEYPEVSACICEGGDYEAGSCECVDINDPDPGNCQGGEFEGWCDADVENCDLGCDDTAWVECYTSWDLAHGTAEDPDCVKQSGSCTQHCEGCNNATVIYQYCKESGGTEPPPPGDLIGCWDTGCESSDDCEEGLSCRFQDDALRCVNPSCPTEPTCSCGTEPVGCWKSCDRDSDCEAGLGCYDDGSGAKVCRTNCGDNENQTTCTCPTAGTFSCDGLTLTGGGVSCSGSDCGEVYPGAVVTLEVEGDVDPGALTISRYSYVNPSNEWTLISGLYDRNDFPYGSRPAFVAPSEDYGTYGILGVVGTTPSPNDGNNNNDSAGRACGGTYGTVWVPDSTGYHMCNPDTEGDCSCTSTACYKTLDVIEPPSCDWLRLYEDTNSNGVYDAGVDQQTSSADEGDTIFVRISGDVGDKGGVGYPKYRYAYILSDNTLGYFAETPVTDNPYDFEIGVVDIPEFDETITSMIIGGSVVNADNVECNGYRNLVQLPGGDIIGSCDNGETEQCYKPLALGDEPLGEFTIVKEVDPVSVSPGDEVEFTLTITNTGDTSAYIQRVNDTLPEGFTYNDECRVTKPDGLGFDCTPILDGRSMVWTFSTDGADAIYLGPGEHATIVFTVLTPDEAGTYLNVACLVIPSDGCDNAPVYVGVQPPTAVPTSLYIGAIVGGGLLIVGAGMYLVFRPIHAKAKLEKRFS